MNEREGLVVFHFGQLIKVPSPYALIISESYHVMQVRVFVHTLVRAGIIKGEVTGDIRNHTLSEISHQSPTADQSV